MSAAPQTDLSGGLHVHVQLAGGALIDPDAPCSTACQPAAHAPGIAATAEKSPGPLQPAGGAGRHAAIAPQAASAQSALPSLLSSAPLKQSSSPTMPVDVELA